MRVISIKKINNITNQPYTYTYIMDKVNSIGYSDFIKDPIDPKLFNTELVVKDDDDDGIIVLKCTKKLKASSELFLLLARSLGFKNLGPIIGLYLIMIII